ncbi:GAF domain-containing protein [Streptomyces sp. NPDC101455]|uniref:GAF domain-containing protein n=1 Tax=Streptomyces sp. NPDC101455 TaxID=3366142 RepID=UPI00382775E2
MDATHDLAHFRSAGPQRTARLITLGLNTPDAEDTFDRVAALAAQLTQSPLAMVNFINTEHQMFRGRYVPPAPTEDGVNVQDGIPFDLSELGREAEAEYGFCPLVVDKKAQLALDDVFLYPRFSGNPLVNDLGVRAYLGTPLLDNTGQVLGTLCVADFKARVWTRQVMDGMKELSATLLPEFKLRDSLLAQARDLFSVFDVAGFPIMLTYGHDHRLHYANAKLGEAFGWHPQFSPGRQALPGLDDVGVFRAMDDALRSGAPITLPRVSLYPFDTQRREDFSIVCTPVRTSPKAPFTGVLTVATSLTNTTETRGIGDAQTFSTTVQGSFEQLSPGGHSDPFPGR